jgi:hypothetical protein
MNEQEQKEYQEKVAGYDAKYAAVNAGLPEAGGIAYCTVYSRMGVAVNITGRGVNPVRAAEALIEAIALLSPVYHLTPDKHVPQAAAPTPPADVKIVAQENKPLAANLQADFDKVPDPPAGKVWQVLTVALVKVIPQPEGRVNIEFYEAGHKWADAKVQNWKMDSAVGLMKHVTSEPMDKPGEYKLDCALYYVDGKEKPNKPGTFYRDVMHVRPIPY